MPFFDEMPIKIEKAASVSPRTVNRYEITFAIPNAAAAAIPPIKVV